jgi:predicted nucleic acid-binding Zn ribbon protein
MDIRTTLLAAGAAFSLTFAVPLAQGDAAAHKAWMSDAADAQDELREVLAAKAFAKAEAPAAKLEELMGKTEQYWAGKHADDIAKLAQESRALAKQVAVAAKARSATRASTAFEKMNKTCNACHDLHPEKR